MPYKREDIEPIGEKDVFTVSPLNAGVSGTEQRGVPRNSQAVTRVTPPVLGVLLLFSLTRSTIVQRSIPTIPGKARQMCINRAGWAQGITG